MTEKVYLDAGSRDDFHRFLLNVICHPKWSDERMKRFGIYPGCAVPIPDSPGKHGIPLDIEFKINGVEVSLVEYVRTIHEQIDDMVERRAKEIVKDKLGEFENTMNNMTQDVVQAVKRKASEAGIEVYSNDY